MAQNETSCAQASGPIPTGQLHCIRREIAIGCLAEVADLALIRKLPGKPRLACLFTGSPLTASARQPGSWPLDLNTAPAAGVVRNRMSACAAAAFLAAALTPPWKTV